MQIIKNKRRCMDVKDAREREKILQAVGTDII
jgi:hypothetical protein